MSIGFVIQPQGVSLEPLIDAARIANGRTHVVIDEAKAVPAFQALGAQVIYRASKDDHAHEKFDAAQFVEELHAAAPAGALLHLGNEPGRNNLAQLNRWTLAALQACDRVGRKGVCFNFETGNPEPEQWAELADAMRYAYANGHVCGLHEYFDGHVARSAPWHVGRFQNVYRAFGQQAPRIMITELGCAVRYNPYDGWQTYHTQGSYADELEIAHRDYYAPFGIDALVYLLGYWDRSATFDARGQAEIFRRMAAMNTAAPGEIEGGEDMAPPGWKQIRTKGDVALRVRAAPGLSTQTLTTVKTGDWVLRLPGSTVQKDGYTWAPYAVQKDAQTHLHGVIALEYVALG